MQALSTKPRTHYVVLHDGRQFAITEQQYEGIKFDKKGSKVSDMFELRDADTNKIIFDGEFRSIKEFREISKNVSKHTYYCSYGNTHNIHDECECKEKYNVAPGVFRKFAYDLFGKTYEVEERLPSGRMIKRKFFYSIYMQDLTYQQRNSIVEQCPKYTQKYA